jgi:hypothetical protein
MMAGHTTYGAGQLRTTRPTTWPPSVVPMPLMSGPARDVQLVDEPPALMFSTSGSSVRLPDEWVLRELPRLDLDNPATIVELYETFGPVVPLSDQGELLPTEAFGTVGIVDAQRAVTRWGQSQWRALSDSSGVSSPRQARAGARYLSAVSLTVVRHYLDFLRALVGHVVAYQRHRPLARAWQDVPLNRPVNGPAHAWFLFEHTMNAALQRFSVTVMATKRKSPFHHAPFYAVAALQIFNVFVEGLPVLTCTNERCARLFQRQLGRAAKGQYRTSGVMFCSHQCADAQRQRERRHQQRKDDR